MDGPAVIRATLLVAVLLLLQQFFVVFLLAASPRAPLGPPSRFLYSIYVFLCDCCLPYNDSNVDDNNR